MHRDNSLVYCSLTLGERARVFYLASRGSLVQTPKESCTVFLLPSSVASHWLLLLALFWQAELSSSHYSTSSSSFSITHLFLPHAFLFSLTVIWQICCFSSLASRKDGEIKHRLEKTSQDFFRNCPPTTLLTPLPPPPVQDYLVCSLSDTDTL